MVTVSDRITVHLAVEVELLGPVRASQADIAAALTRQIAAIQYVWPGSGIKRPAYKIRAVREETTHATH